MHRVLAGGIAIFVGLVLAAVIIWFWVGGGSDRSSSETLGWTLLVGLFTLPALAIPMALGLLLLEGIASWLKRPRMQVLLLGPIVIPLGLFLLVGAPYLLAMPFNESAGNSVVTGLIMAAAAIAPAFVVSVIYALLTRNSVDRV